MTRKYIEELLGESIKENVNDEFFEIHNDGFDGYVFVKTSAISKEFQDMINDPEYENNSVYVGNYDVTRGIYLSKKGQLKEIDSKFTCCVNIRDRITDFDKKISIKDALLDAIDDHIRQGKRLKLYFD